MLPYIVEEDMAIKEIGNVYGKDVQVGRLYDTDADCPTIICNGGVDIHLSLWNTNMKD